MLSEDKCRLSVSGWFHGSSLERPPRSLDPLPVRSPHIPCDVRSIHICLIQQIKDYVPADLCLSPQHEILYEWINPVYLSVAYQAQIQEEFEESSEILLKDFLKVCAMKIIVGYSENK